MTSTTPELLTALHAALDQALELGARAVSPTFQQYLTAWKNFVAD